MPRNPIPRNPIPGPEAPSASAPERPQEPRRSCAALPPQTHAAGNAAARKTQGLLSVYTGSGKGKTTAALGAVFRALGWGMPVAVVQFVKGRWRTGERRMAESLPGLIFEVTGEGFTWDSEDLSRDAEAARRGWARVVELLREGACALLVLDEITYPLNYGWVSLDEVLAALRARPPGMHVILTGRHAPPALMEAADLVTEMQAHKHPLEQGVRAQRGLDY